MQRIITATLAAALLICGLIASAGSASAQGARTRTDARDVSSEQRVRRARPRIVVTPTRRFLRQCIDIYSIEQRASGPTVVPNMRCWWVYR